MLAANKSENRRVLSGTHVLVANEELTLMNFPEIVKSFCVDVFTSAESLLRFKIELCITFAITLFIV